MPHRTNDFQNLVYLLQHQLRDRPGATVSESMMLVDRNTGKRREVDIVVELVANDIVFVIAFECSESLRSPGIEWVEQQIKKHEFLSDKLVLVSNRPFSFDAADLARRHGVEVIEFRQASDIDWPLSIDRDLELQVLSADFELEDFRLVYGLIGDGPRLDDRAAMTVRDASGGEQSLVSFIEAALVNNEMSKKMMSCWLELPAAERDGNTFRVTFDFVPPPAVPLSCVQGSLVYPMLKIKFIGVIGVSGGNMKLARMQFARTRVAHGTSTLSRGRRTGQTIRLVASERPGTPPRGVMTMSADPRVRTLEVTIPEERREIERP